MRVQMLKTVSVKIDNINTKNYPADWKGEVDDLFAIECIETGAAVPIGADLTKPVQLTNEELAVLKFAAQQALASSESGETVDPETGEIVQKTGEQSPAEVLASMTRKELNALAKEKGVKYTARSREDVEADLLKLVSAPAA